MAIMRIDGIAKRYKMLPSRVLQESDVFDLYIIETALNYEQYLHKKAQNKGQPPAEAYTQEQLMEMFNKTR